MADERDPTADPEADRPDGEHDPAVIEDLDLPGDDADSVVGGSFIVKEG
jgi:hypothetical protein